MLFCLVWGHQSIHVQSEIKAIIHFQPQNSEDSIGRTTPPASPESHQSNPNPQKNKAVAMGDPEKLFKMAD